jgi:SAM-dependent methyltransferase
MRAPFYDEDADIAGREILKAFIKRIKPQSLIEIGCGTGILFRLFKDVPDVTVCDFSVEMLRIAQKRNATFGYGFKFQLRDIVKVPPEGRWDLALIRTVLMHLNPTEAKQAIANIATISNQVVLAEYWEQAQSSSLSSHCFLHDYPALFKEHGFVLKEVIEREDLPQPVFWFVKENGD